MFVVCFFGNVLCCVSVVVLWIFLSMLVMFVFLLDIICLNRLIMWSLVVGGM